MESEVLVGDGIATAVRNIRPDTIVVAYLGADWSKYLPDIDAVKYVVLAPILGTNPWAVENLVKALSRNGMDGWERILFLDNIHAKLFLGRDSAVWGSANLSRNGLGGDRLIELCTFSRNIDHLADLRRFVDEVKAQALRAYPSIQSRKRQLSLLKQESSRNPDVYIKFAPSSAPSLRDFELLSEDQFYVCWYLPRWPEPKLRGDAAIAESSGSFKDWTPVLPNDVEPGKWLLMWPATVNEIRPFAGKAWSPRWLMIDEVFGDAIDNTDSQAQELGDPYTSVVCQLESREIEGLERQPPFNLDDPATTYALRETLLESEIRASFVQPERLGAQGDGYSIRLSMPALPLLIERMKVRLTSPL